MTFRYLILFAMLAVPALSFSEGAPREVCSDMKPQHGPEGQTSAIPYTLTANKKQTKSGDTVELTLSGKSANDLILGFLVEGRVGTTAIGKFIVDPNNKYMQTIDCGKGKNNALTHKKISGKGIPSIQFRWVSPSGLSGDVKFHITVVKDVTTYWVKQLGTSVLVN